MVFYTERAFSLPGNFRRREEIVRGCWGAIPVLQGLEVAQGSDVKSKVEDDGQSR